MHEIDS